MIADDMMSYIKSDIVVWIWCIYFYRYNSIVYF